MNKTIPIINITAQNTGVENFGGCLTLQNFKESYVEDTFNNTNNLDITKNYLKNLTSTFKDNNFIPTITDKLNIEEMKKNTIKFITIVPIRKEIIVPTKPAKAIMIDENNWFMSNIVFSNNSMLMNNKSAISKAKANVGILNNLEVTILFNIDIDFALGADIKTFQFLFQFSFNVNFLSTFFFNFEFLKDTILDFLKDNTQKIKNIETTNNLNLSDIVNDNNTIVKNININELKIKILEMDSYFNKKYFDKNLKIYKLILKLIPQSPINLIEVNDNKFFFRDNINKFLQSTTNENIKLFDNLFNVSNTMINKTEEINIINITNNIALFDNTSTSYKNIKKFLKSNLITFLNKINVFPNILKTEHTNTLKSIPTEISYNTYKNKNLIEIGTRQIILKFENDINFVDDLYSKIFIIQYNIEINELEFIPVIDPKNYSAFTSTNIDKTYSYNLDNIQKDFRLYLTLFKKITYSTNEYFNYTIFNDNVSSATNKTNIHKLKIIKNYNLTQTQINELI